MIWEQNTATIVMVTNLKERKEVGKLKHVNEICKGDVKSYKSLHKDKYD